MKKQITLVLTDEENIKTYLYSKIKNNDEYIRMINRELDILDNKLNSLNIEQLELMLHAKNNFKDLMLDEKLRKKYKLI